MYETFYRLAADPFRLSPDPRFCFEHPSFTRARKYMQYALHRAEGFIMVTGEPGTGKTTLVESLLSALPIDGPLAARLVAAQLQPDELLRKVAYAFGLRAEHMGKATLLHELERFLMQQTRMGRGALLVIDEAQGLGASSLEELRLLTNLQENARPLLQIFLVGQEQLRQVVHSPELEQFHQRLIAACHLRPLTPEETRAYVEHRLRRVGWQRDPLITADAFLLMHRFSGGVPRRINQACSRLLLHGAAEERHRLDGRDVLTVVEDLRQETLAPAHLPDRRELEDLLATLPPEPEPEPEPIPLPVRPAPAMPVIPAEAEPAEARQGPPTPAAAEPPEAPARAAPSPAESAMPVPLSPPASPAPRGEVAAGTTSPPSRPAPGREALPPRAAPPRRAPDPKPREEHPAPPAERAGRPALRRLLPPLVLAAAVGSLLYGILQVPPDPLGEDLARPLRGALDRLVVALRESPLAPYLPATPQPPAPPPTEAVPPPAELPAGATSVASGPVLSGTGAPRSPPTTPAPSGAGPPPSPDAQGPVPPASPPSASVADEPPSLASVPGPPALLEPETSPEVTAEPPGPPMPPAAAAEAIEVEPPPESPSTGPNPGPPGEGLERALLALGLEARQLADGTIHLNLRREVPFALSSAEVPPESQLFLDRLAEVLREHDGHGVEVVGHTDSSGNREYNAALARRRAESVANYLRARGVPAERLTTRARTGVEPGPDARDAGRTPAAQRRIELYITRLADHRA
jgi:putative secretion ATPase (PEP-CTERM system associated)